MMSTAASKAFLPGSLVRARGRDWVVLPGGESDVLLLRPVTGSVDETIGVFLPLEGSQISETTFAPPDPARAGDATGAMLLFDAARLSLRSGAAPFRSLGHISVIPRPYQFVPLIMALRQSTVRLLIADDVGVGKTIEAAMIARELLDRGIARRLAVVCASHLCDQWAGELRDKFGIEAAVVQPSTVARLERGLPRGDLSIYQYYPHLIVSVDYVKSDRNRGHFLQNAPDLIIVDEVHTAARPRGEGDRARHERFRLARDLADDASRHLVLVTATPHSGIEESFRSLLGLLDRSFDVVDGNPDDLDQKALLPYVVQRRRRDLERWLGSDTPFPSRDSRERTYALDREYHALFEDVLGYCRETVSADGGPSHHQRVRHWAAIALLRCLLSSPAAAVAVLQQRQRRQAPGNAPPEVAEGDADAVYRPQVLDPIGDEVASDYVPTAPLDDAEPSWTPGERRRLSGFVGRAAALLGADRDTKLIESSRELAAMLRDGHQPIVFCRFIATANYLAAELPRLLGKEFADLRVRAVTGEIGDEERRERIAELGREGRRLLVATDCLSEGINLQEHFDAVLHYDLPWNPNRLEQREGRVDRFGQPNPVVRTTLLYGADNPVDVVVLDVLLRKARTIRQRLGVAVPVPVDSEQVVQAVVDSVLLRTPARGDQLALSGLDAGVQLKLSLFDAEVSRLHLQWDAAAEREGKQRAYFAQRGIHPDEVAREIEECDPVLGDAAAVRRFLAHATSRSNGALRPTPRPGVFELDPGDLGPALHARGFKFPAAVAFDAPPPDASAPRSARRATPPLVLGRTHPIVAAGCDAVLGAALGREWDDRFARSGAIFTDGVTRRTGVVLLRLRYLLREDSIEQFAEEIVLAAFGRGQTGVAWLEPFDSIGRDLLERAEPIANLSPAERAEQVTWALDSLRSPGALSPVVAQRVERLKVAHDRLRRLVKNSVLTIQPRDPPDILGCYVLVPTGGN